MSIGLLRVCAVLIALGTITPALTRGQLPLFPAANCCQTCYLPQPRCHCVRFKPVVETRMRPQQVMTWRNVSHTAYRCQARVETVPVVTYQTRLRYDMIPYTVTRRVPQCTTTLVPERRIRYVPEHAVTSPIAPRASLGVQWQQVGRGTSPIPASAPIFQQSPVAEDYSDWTTISSRKRTVTPTPTLPTNGLHHPGNERRQTAQPVSHRRARSPHKPFVRAPSAALVWQTPGPR